VVSGEKERVVESIEEATRMLESTPGVADLVPEVQMNLAMALPSFYARGSSDVAAIPGRTVKLDGREMPWTLRARL